MINNHGPKDSGKNLVWLLDLFLFCRPKFELLPSKLEHLVIKKAEFRVEALLSQHPQIAEHVHEEARSLHARVLPGGDRLGPGPGRIPRALRPGQTERYDGRQDPGSPFLRALYQNPHVL